MNKVAYKNTDLNLILFQMCLKVGKCCCCLDLRTGAIVIAVLGIVGSLVTPAFDTRWMVISEIILGLLVSFCLLFGAIKENEIAVLIYLILNMLQIISEFAVGIFLLVAGTALKVASQDDGVTVANTTSVHQDDGSTVESGAIGIAATIGGLYIILWACVDIYFFICVHSFYRKIKDGKITSAA